MQHHNDLICLSHLRWNFVFQRPNHLMSRCARTHRVFFVEEPMHHDGPARLDVTRCDHGPLIVVPHLPRALPRHEALATQRALLDELVATHDIRLATLWYYTPMALEVTRHLPASLVVYDCMDELSAFRFAPPELVEREHELFTRADLVFTGGQSLYEAKRGRHPRVHAFPSSVDVQHFAHARDRKDDPPDQARIPHPRLGFFGVIDERMDLALVDGLAALRPDWHIVMVGPVAKIDPAHLPRRPNIHWLGGKSYTELPSYIGGWDAAIMPFAINASTRFISPTKTPEFLAAGRPVVSTAITDVVTPYQTLGLVEIADDAPGFAAAIERMLAADPVQRRGRADAFLSTMSWDTTWSRMLSTMEHARARRLRRAA